MPASPAQAKICVVCGKDCSTIDRVKDAEGRYTCKPCHDGKLKPGGGEVRPVDIASLYERPESRPCPQCDKPVPHDAEVCVACGYNLRSGKPVKTKLGKADPRTAAAMEAASAARRKPKRWVIGAVAGGLVGAAAWVLATFFMADGAIWMGAATGALTGLGVFAAAREHCGPKPLLIALAFAVVFGAIGKAGSSAVLTLAHGPKHAGGAAGSEGITLNDEGARGMFAREVAQKWVDQGKQLYWPMGFDIKNAKAQEHFPPEVWTEASTQWEANGQGWQQQYRNARQTELQFAADEQLWTDRKAHFIAGFGMWDGIYAGIGLVLAGLCGGGVLNLLKKS